MRVLCFGVVREGLNRAGVNKGGWTKHTTRCRCRDRHPPTQPTNQTIQPTHLERQPIQALGQRQHALQMPPDRCLRVHEQRQPQRGRQAVGGGGCVGGGGGSSRRRRRWGSGWGGSGGGGSVLVDPRLRRLEEGLGCLCLFADLCRCVRKPLRMPRAVVCTCMYVDQITSTHTRRHTRTLDGRGRVRPEQVVQEREAPCPQECQLVGLGNQRLVPAPEGGHAYVCMCA